MNFEKTFDLVKMYIEAKNKNLVVKTFPYIGFEGSDGKTRNDMTGVCIGHKDGTLFKSSFGTSNHWYLYRSKRDFVKMLFGRETKAGEKFRKSHYSPQIRPIANSLEELKLRYEIISMV